MGGEMLGEETVEYLAYIGYEDNWIGLESDMLTRKCDEGPAENRNTQSIAL